jgi:amino acid transporter
MVKLRRDTIQYYCLSTGEVIIMNEEKKLGLGSGVAICMGLIVATSCLVSLGQGFGLAGTSFIVAMIIVAVLNGFVALSFAELNHMMPGITGGVGQYTLVGLGPWASIVSNLSAYAITDLFAIAVELSMCGIVLNGLFPSVSTAVFSVIVIMLLFTLNLFSIDIFARVQAVMVSLLVGSMIVLGILGLFQLGSGTPVSPAEIDPPIKDMPSVISLAALAFWLFIGVEFVVPMSKDMKNPRRNIPLSMVITLVILLVVQSVLGTGMSHYVNTDTLLSVDMPHIAYAEALLGRPGMVWMSFVTLVAAASTLNTVLPSVGKILQGMAEEGMLPKPLAYTNKYNSPWVVMTIFVTIILVMVLSGYINSNGLINMILAASCFWLVSYVLTHLNVLVLRKRYPNAPRINKLKLGGVPQIIGMIGCVYMIWNISSDMDERIMIYKTFGVLFGFLAVFAFIWVKFIVKSPLFKPTDMDKINAG